jgi:hypothetical protein
VSQFALCRRDGHNWQGPKRCSVCATCGTIREDKGATLVYRYPAGYMVKGGEMNA